MDMSVYGVLAERAVREWMRTVAVHYGAVIEAGWIGEAPTEERSRAAFFEVGSLHLYVLDRELRKERQDDERLRLLRSHIGRWLLETYPGKSQDNVWGHMLGGRLERYQAVADNGHGEEPLDFLAGSVRDERLHALARQLMRCLAADGSVPHDSGLFLGVVEESLFLPAADPLEEFRYVSGIKETLYEHLLPLQQIAASWSADGPFYQKSVEELDRRAEQAQAQAEQLWEKRRRELVSVVAQVQWARWLEDGTRFSVLDQDGQWSTTRQACDASIEGDDRGLPYLRAHVDEVSGMTVRALLLLAYDLNVGLTTAVRISETDEEARDVPLSLGAIIGLLRHGTGGNPDGRQPDVSDVDRLQVTRPDAWHISFASRSSLFYIFQRLEMSTRPVAPLQSATGAAGLPPLRKRYPGRRETSPPEVSPLPETRIGWVEDATGAGALVVAPASEENLGIFVTWLMPPGTAIVGEAAPHLARYPLMEASDDEDTGTEGAPEAFDGATGEGEALLHDPNSRFERTEQVVYGAAGEPYEVIRCVETVSDDSEEDEDAEAPGRPLLDFALPCYDLGRGIAVRGERGALIARVPFGEVITLLREGALADKETAGEASPEAAEEETALDLSQPITEPDGVTYPRMSLRGIAWVLRRAGVAHPGVGVVRTTAGTAALCIGPLPAEAAVRHWAQWRIAWYLPPEARTFAFVEHPALTPFPLP